MDSLAGSLPRQQQEPPVSPPIAAGASSSRTHTGREASVGAATRPDATLYRAPQPRQTKSSRDAAERNRRGSKAPPPGSASMSASQVQALLARLDDLESREAARTAAEEELKTVNVALMDRLTAFRAVNDENVAQAEAELSALGEALAHAQRERAEATAAADEAEASAGLMASWKEVVAETMGGDGQGGEEMVGLELAAMLRARLAEDDA